MASERRQDICDRHEVCPDESCELTTNLRPQLPTITRAILASTRDDSTYDHTSSETVPSWEAVVDTVELLRDLLFPGYFGEQFIDPSELEYHLGVEVGRVFDQLSSQIARSLRHNCLQSYHACNQCVNRGEQEAIAFLRRIPEIRRLLGTDVRAAYDGDPAAYSHDEVVFAYPGLMAVTVYRIAHELWQQRIPLLPRMMTEYAHSRTGIDIHPGATIDESFFIDHGTGVVIGETAEVGKRVRLYQGVTIGARSLPRDSSGGYVRGAKRHPTIEDDVTIYANATILGGDTVIGARSVIGASVFLNKSVPADTSVMPEHPPLSFRNTAKSNAADLA